MRSVPGPLKTTIFFFSRATSSTARAGADPATSMMASTFWTSYHSRALAAAMSALFWWSTTIRSIFLPSTVPPKSATAISAAVALPLPVTSA